MFERTSDNECNFIPNDTQILEIGHKAIQYAKDYIKKSSTLDGKYDFAAYESLISEIDTMRLLPDFIFQIDPEDEVEWFFQTIKHVKKSGLGNCTEMSLLALHYIIKHSPYPASLYKIENADHAFVVIHKSLNCNIEGDLPWGANDYICDPFSGAVYPVSEFKEKLKGSGVRITGRHYERFPIHHTDEDPNEENVNFKISKIEGYHSDSLRNLFQVEAAADRILEIFNTHLDTLLEILENDQNNNTYKFFHHQNAEKHGKIEALREFLMQKSNEIQNAKYKKYSEIQKKVASAYTEIDSKYREIYSPDAEDQVGYVIKRPESRR